MEPLSDWWKVPFITHHCEGDAAAEGLRKSLAYGRCEAHRRPVVADSYLLRFRSLFWNPSYILFHITCMHAFVQVHLSVLYYYYSIGNIRICYTIPYLVVLRVLQDMFVLLDILLYFVKLLYASSINRRSSCSIQPKPDWFIICSSMFYWVITCFYISF